MKPTCQAMRTLKEVRKAVRANEVECFSKLPECNSLESSPAYLRSMLDAEEGSWQVPTWVWQTYMKSLIREHSSFKAA